METETEPRGQGRPLAVVAFQAAAGTRPWPLDTASDSASSRFLPFYAKLFAIYFPKFFEERILCFRRVFFELFHPDCSSPTLAIMSFPSTSKDDFPQERHQPLLGGRQDASSSSST